MELNLDLAGWAILILGSLLSGVVATILWFHLFGSASLDAEIERNKITEAPDENQLRWHIQHIRQDIISMTRILFFILVALLVLLGKVLFFMD